MKKQLAGVALVLVAVSLGSIQPVEHVRVQYT